MYEHHHVDMTLIHSDFGSTQGLSDELAKQLGMVLQRSLFTIPQDPIFLVSVKHVSSWSAKEYKEKLCLEVSTLVSKYPDIKDGHIGTLLATQGDGSQNMKQTIIRNLEQGPMEIVVPSLNVVKLLK
ncbi:hypothetical protein J1605_020651 [Eschrichtius robustus]|uniref:Uncharacterized protein n=1 Tax=Eschrichtius robustus TaxID=9764 RepID=A0AB34HL05_ESCRO|nr:hypothetical protein J1605_020651 [Eschrichtius robustus]